MRSNQIENYKKRLKLTEKQRDVLVGVLLGDGCLETQNQGRTYRLKVEHSLSQKDYTDWLFGIFKDWVLTEPKPRKYTSYSRERTNYRFSTISHGSFRFYAQQFYRNGKKVMPKLIGKMLSPLALAVWFMDDGSIKSKQHKALVIHAQSFERADLERIIFTLKKNFGVGSVLRKRSDGSGYIIYLLSETVDNFINLIKPYILPAMEYKLGNTIA